MWKVLEHVIFTEMNAELGGKVIWWGVANKVRLFRG